MLIKWPLPNLQSSMHELLMPRPPMVWDGVFRISRPRRTQPVVVSKAQLSVAEIHWYRVNTMGSRPNGRHFADDTFKRIFINENITISINISLKFVPNGLIDNIQHWLQIMAWRRPGDKPLSETMRVNLLTPICVTRPQWVKERFYKKASIRKCMSNRSLN